MPPNSDAGSRYSLDTSALLNSWRRFYPPDVFTSLWDRIDELIAKGILVASEEVLVELGKKDDEVYRWARQRLQMFVPIDGQQQQLVRNILAIYPTLVDTRRNRSGADPFVIALAQLEGRTVVTYESPSNNPSRPHIPDVCVGVGIRCISFLKLIRERGWQI